MGITKYSKELDEEEGLCICDNDRTCPAVGRLRLLAVNPNSPANKIMNSQTFHLEDGEPASGATGRDQSPPFEEVKWTKADDMKLTRKLLTQVMAETVTGLKVKSLITVKAKINQDLTQLWIKMSGRRHKFLADMTARTSSLASCLQTMQSFHQLMAPAADSLLDKSRWTAGDSERALKIGLALTEVSQLKESLITLIHSQTHELEKQEEEMREVDKLLIDSKKIELRTRITPVQLQQDLRGIKHCDLRPGEKQVILTPSHIEIDEVKQVNGKVMMAKTKRALKQALTPIGWGYPMSHRVIRLREEELEELPTDQNKEKEELAQPAQEVEKEKEIKKDQE